MANLLRILVSIILVKISFETRTSDTELVYLSLISRHGPATPAKFYPFLSSCDAEYWDKYKGPTSLTPKGMEAVYNFGKEEAKYYKNFLGEVYNETLYKSSASFLTECLQSGLVFSAALYEPLKVQQWSKSLNWLPIPTNPSHDDLIYFYMNDNCKDLWSLYDEVYKSDEYLNFKKSFDKIVEELKKESGQKDADFIYFSDLAYNLESYVAEGCKLPNWIEKNFDKLNTIKQADYFYGLNTYLNFSRLLSGQVLYKLTQQLSNKANNELSTKLDVFFTSYFELHSVLALLQKKSTMIEYPEFLSTLFVELRKDKNNNYFVKLVYKNNPPNEPSSFKNFRMNGCSLLCPLEKFKMLVKDDLVSDQNEICGNTQNKKKETKNTNKKLRRYSFL